MSGRPWGRTGRVTLQDIPALEDDEIVHVLVDGRFAGMARLSDPTRAGLGDGWEARGLPSPDAAVMWVLSHARGDGTQEDRKRIRNVWRRERGDVWRVRYTTDLPEAWIDGPVSEFWDELEGDEYPWRVIAPDGVTQEAYTSHRNLTKYAAKDVAHWSDARSAAAK